MKYALIGCGRISPNHIEAAKNNGLEIAAICDILPEAMQDKVDRFSLDGVHCYTDYKEMLEENKPKSWLNSRPIFLGGSNNSHL